MALAKGQIGNNRGSPCRPQKGFSFSLAGKSDKTSHYFRAVTTNQPRSQGFLLLVQSGGRVGENPGNVVAVTTCDHSTISSVPKVGSYASFSSHNSSSYVNSFSVFSSSS